MEQQENSQMQQGATPSQASQGQAPSQLEPHRGVAVLVLGILGLVLCFILGIIAWVMGNTDLQKMETGQMDRSGEGLTKAGKICGMVSVLLWIIGIVGWFFIAGIAAVASTMG